MHQDSALSLHQRLPQSALVLHHPSELVLRVVDTLARHVGLGCVREVYGCLNFRRRDGVMDERTQCVYARLNRVHGLQVECVARLDTLATPYGLHDAIAAEIAREYRAAASAVASHEDHNVAKLPAVLRVPTKVGA
eukprot:99960-Prymnesium_polylepis.1